MYYESTNQGTWWVSYTYYSQFKPPESAASDGSWNGQYSGSGGTWSAEIYPPQDPEQPQSIVLAPEKEQKKLNQLKETRLEVQNNSDNITEQIYRNYEPGEINMTDVMSASEMAEEYESDDAGHYSWAALYAAKRGYSADVGTAMEIDYTTNNSTSHYTELIYADQGTFPNSTVEVGQ